MRKRVNLFLVLISTLLFNACLVASDVNPNEYSKLLLDMQAKRTYPVLRKPYEVPMLIKALGDKYEVVRFNAALDLKALGPKAREALIPLIERYADKDQRVAEVSFAASRRVLGDPYIPPDPPTWFFGYNKVIDPADNLLNYLNTGTEQQKIWSLQLLSKMGDGSRPAVDKALKLLGDSSSNIRQQTQGFLQNVETDLTGQLVEALASKAPNIRSSACLVLGLREEKSAIEHVRPLLNDSEPAVRFSAAESLARLGDSSTEVGNILSAGLGSLSASKEAEIIKLLNKRGFSTSVNSYYSQKISQQKQIQGKLKSDIESRARKAAENVREKLLKDRERVKKNSVLSAENKGTSRIEIIKNTTIAESGTVPQRISALKSLSALAPYYPEAFKPVVSALSNENPTVRAYAAKLLGELRKTEAVDDLILVLQDESVDVQDSAIASLSIIGTPEALGAISSFPEDVIQGAVSRALRESSGQIQALVQCSDARSLCRIYLQQSGSPVDTLNDEAAICAYIVQPGC